MLKTATQFVSTEALAGLITAYLCLSRVPVMAWNSDLVEEAMKLPDDGGNLLRKVAGVHCGDAQQREAC